MIIKSLSRKSNGTQLIKYIFRYVLDQDKIKGIKVPTKAKEPAFLIRHNVRSRSVEGMIREFKENEQYRLVHRKDSVKLFHTIISFSGKDTTHVNDKLLKDIAKKFISERGTNSLYIGTKHENKDHIHVHLCISGVQTNGRSSRITKQQFHHIKLELDRYQKRKYPELIHSLPEHGRAKQQKSKEAILENVKQSRQTKKEALCTILEKTYKNSTSVDHFLSELQVTGYEPYYRNGKLQGVLYEGQKFRLGRLGYDEASLQALDQAKVQEEQTLAQMQQLRQGIAREQQIEVNRQSELQTQALNAQEQQDLQELQDLRTHAPSRATLVNTINHDVDIEYEQEIDKLRQRNLSGYDQTRER